ncbi:MBL fold metallo-hydrolase [Candidatus Nomurabacteria bacterium]|nr:MBL fold metallo-hydrolase [Candidatus Nomurabacteria bacterium]
MVITYQGIEFFKVQFGETILAFGPVSKDSKFKTPRFGADVAFISLNDKDMNGGDNVSLADKNPVVISGPGEYEVKEVFIKGFPTKSTYGGKERINTIYTMAFDGMKICYLGALGTDELPVEAKEAIDDIDILFVPIGGEGVLSASSAYKLAVKLEPKIIIPMHYGEIGDKNSLKTFLKEGGADGEALDKLTLKKKDLDGKEGDIIVLSPQSGN